VNKTHPLTQALGLIESILSEMDGLSKPRVRFMRWIFGAWLGLPVRRTLSNLARFGPYCDKSIRLHMERRFAFAEFCQQLIARSCERERICAFASVLLTRLLLAKRVAIAMGLISGGVAPPSGCYAVWNWVCWASLM
jgi:hypothetical protein